MGAGPEVGRDLGPGVVVGLGLVRVVGVGLVPVDLVDPVGLVVAVVPVLLVLVVS